MAGVNRKGLGEQGYRILSQYTVLGIWICHLEPFGLAQDKLRRRIYNPSCQASSGTLDHTFRQDSRPFGKLRVT